MYLVEFQQLDATELIEELDYLKEFFIPIQKQSFLLLKGINAFNNKKFTDAFRFFNKSKDEDVYDDITFLANYYVAFTADKFFKKELSLYYSFIISEYYSKNNNFQRKIDIDFLQAENMILLGNYDEAEEFLKGIRYALINIKGTKYEKDYLMNLYAYLFYMRKDFTKAKYYANKVENPDDSLKHFVYAILYREMGEFDKVKTGIRF
jgi:hypothetical protein